MTLLIQLLVYPGLLWVSLLTTVLIMALGRSARGLGAIRNTLRSLVRGDGSLAHALSAVLALITLALLPWPVSPFAPAVGQDLWRVWAFTELTFLVPLLPGLLSPLPTVSRSAVRTAQIGVSGRAALWIAILVGYGWTGVGLTDLVPLLIGALAAMFALAPAAGWQPFSGESGLGIGDADAYVPPRAIGVARWAADLRSVLLIALIATIFVSAPQLVWWQQLALKVWLALAVALVGRGLRGGAIHRTTASALRYCWLLVIPLAGIALAGRVWLDG